MRFSKIINRTLTIGRDLFGRIQEAEMKRFIGRRNELTSLEKMDAAEGL